MRKFMLAVGLGAALGLPAATQAFAGEMKVSGAAAVANNILLPHKDEIEKTTGLTLAVTVNGDGNGLKDLVAGKSDVMMVAAPLKATAAALGGIDTAGIEVAPVGAIAIRFLVHPSNPVKSLSAAQLADIFSGKITSWKEVGGVDQPIMLVAEPVGFGTRTNIVAGLLNSGEISDKARTVQALAQVAQVVAQVPNAIGYGNAATITAAVAVLPGVEVKQGLGIATKGAPGAEAKKLTEALVPFGASVK